MTIHIGFTGGRRAPTRDQLEWLTLQLAEFYELYAPDVALHHGDCVGKDAAAHEVALRVGYRVVVHPPDLNFLRARCVGAHEVRPVRPYLMRNNDIVRECSIIVAVPDGDPTSRSGTWYTVRRATQEGRDVRVCAHRASPLNARSRVREHT